MRVFCMLILLTGLFAAGCTQADKAKDLAAELNKTNIQKVSNAFSLYGNMNNFKSPKSKEELIEYIKTGDGLEYSLDVMGIDKDKFQDMFVSSVDGEEFIIRYKSRVSAMGGGVPIAFEKTGVDGIRRVGLSNGKVIEADDKTYERLMKGKVSKEEKGDTLSDQADADGGIE